jgi:hypothetical protein
MQGPWYASGAESWPIYCYYKVLDMRELGEEPGLQHGECALPFERLEILKWSIHLCFRPHCGMKANVKLVVQKQIIIFRVHRFC